MTNESLNSTAQFRLAALSGSVRPGNYTSMALGLAVNEARNQRGVAVDVIDATDFRLTLPGQAPTDDSKRMRDLVEAADGVIFATPEYHGSFSSVTKLMIDNLGFPSVLSGKPIALLGVAAGRIGAIKALEHLRSVASHVGGIVLPGPVSVARVRNVFDADGNCLEAQMEQFIRGVATNLIHYIDDNICPRVALESMVRAQRAA
ncbi:MAG: NAD(P)H-dependent oxidoreductase [Rhodothermia bacterium]|nr:NAD(P)H-dependent oxidoreductase [Rhodothermia bacterium]